MAEVEDRKPQASPTVAQVDSVIDEDGFPIRVPEDSSLAATKSAERAVGGTSPGTWSRYALLGIVIVAAILLVLQLLEGAPGTEVQPGSPTAVPVTEQIETPPAAN